MLGTVSELLGRCQDVTIGVAMLLGWCYEHYWVLFGLFVYVVWVWFGCCWVLQQCYSPGLWVLVVYY